MKIKWDGEIREIWTLWREDEAIKMIDQLLLPHKLQILTLTNHKEIVKAINDMAVRGAGAIGIAGGYGVAQAALEAKNMPLADFEKYVSKAADAILRTRPTAVSLFHAINRCLKKSNMGTVNERVLAICNEADKLALEDLAASIKIGENGVNLIAKSNRILTHCNAGALAFIDNGSALAPIREAHRRGKDIFVYVSETRPRSQGAKLTAWELQQEGIPYALIADSASGYYLEKGDIDLVVVGADRIAANGDTANKIGTYEKAVLAKENSVPFYVAAPKMTFDLKCRSGKEILIEERSPDEINWVSGVDDSGRFTKVRISADGTPALNPSFDVTPSRYITCFITEMGLMKPPYTFSIRNSFKQSEMDMEK